MMRTIRHMVLALCSVFILCGTVHAAESPLAVLQTQIDQILNVLKEPNYKDPIKRVPLRAQIEKYVHEIFDFSEFSARTVGRNWPSFSDAQKERFDKAFANLLLITYLDKFRDTTGKRSNIPVKSSRQRVIAPRSRPSSPCPTASPFRWRTG